MASLTFYNAFKEGQLDGTIGSGQIDFDTDTLKLALANSSYTPAATTDTVWANVLSNEVSGGGYASNGETLTSVTVNETGGTVTVDAANVTWSQNATGFADARYAVLYKNDGSANTSSPLIGYIDFTTNKGNTTGDLTVAWNTSGVFTLS